MRADFFQHSARLRLSLLMPIIFACLVCESPPVALADEPQQTSDDFHAPTLAAVEPLVTGAIEAGQMPGCVICFGRSDGIHYLRSFGDRSLAPQREPMTTDTIFDLASLTKPVATATSIMRLVEAGELTLGTRVVEVLPEFGANGKAPITVYDLLTHQSGLIPDNHLRDYRDGPARAWENICELGLVAPIGSTFKYSDVNFMVLAKMVERITGMDLHAYSREAIFAPLGMHETGFNLASELRERAAPTERREGEWMRGEVHDPRAHLLGGIAGHAGLFSTATDLSRYARMMLGEGQLRRVGEPTVRILSPLSVRRMTSPRSVSSGVRGLGWDKQTGYSSNRGDLLSPSAFGHGGFTGTVLWIDPELDLFFVFLSNRLHPDGRGSVNRLAGKILNVVAAALQHSQRQSRAQKTGVTLTGIDVLRRDGFRQLAKRRVGLITNHTGRAADGVSTAALLQRAPDVHLAALFSPEHGLEGKLDIANIADAKDATTGLTVFSLYGETRRPTPEMLAEIDTVVIDIQDIGCRFYTYISTMGEAMIATAEQNKKFVVLDRPNPINGADVMGPMLDEGAESFVGFHNLPVRHGMTIGEIAKLIRDERQLDLDLQVIPCEGWRRESYWESTHLLWINPSPNMRSLTQALLYPGVGLLEMTNVSVGRGTDTPFEVLGAPWIDARQLARRLNARGLAGTAFVPVQFTPEESKYAGENCGGINILVTDRQRLEPIRVGLAIARALRELYPEQWDTTRLNRLMGNRELRDAILRGDSLDELIELSRRDLGDFLRRRDQHLLYR